MFGWAFTPEPAANVLPVSGALAAVADRAERRRHAAIDHVARPFAEARARLLARLDVFGDDFDPTPARLVAARWPRTEEGPSPVGAPSPVAVPVESAPVMEPMTAPAPVDPPPPANVASAPAKTSEPAPALASRPARKKPGPQTGPVTDDDFTRECRRVIGELQRDRLKLTAANVSDRLDCSERTVYNRFKRRGDTWFAFRKRETRKSIGGRRVPFSAPERLSQIG